VLLWCTEYVAEEVDPLRILQVDIIAVDILCGSTVAEEVDPLRILQEALTCLAVAPISSLLRKSIR